MGHFPVIRELTPPLSTQATGIAALAVCRSHDLEQLNEQLRQAHAREREVFGHRVVRVPSLIDGVRHRMDMQGIERGLDDGARL